MWESKLPDKFTTLRGVFLAFILSNVLSDEHSNEKLTDLSLKVADILVNVEESNVSFIGSFEISNGTRFNDTELIKDIKFHYYSRWFIETAFSRQFISV